MSARLLWYGAVVFLTSACLMVLEIAAARLIAPYVGVSLYTWTAIIGVMLGGLSAGNWLGGWLAERRAGGGTCAAVLCLGGLASLAVLVLLTWLAPLLQAAGLGLLWSSFLYVAALFALPSLLIGIMAPLLTVMALDDSRSTGRVLGAMHALAALGSIAGTFLAGYWLVQSFGTRAVVAGCGVMLMVLAVGFVRRRSVPVLAAGMLAALLLGLAGWLRTAYQAPCTVESQYYCIRVVDASDQVPFGRAEAMVLDHLLHGINHASEPGMLVSPYVQAMDELVLGYLGEDWRTARYFFAGGGAYTHPRAVHSLSPQARITVAEVDAEVTRVARERMGVDLGGMRILHQDARIALASQPPASFDVVVGDVFHDLAVPYHLTTVEYAALVRSRLRPGGLYLLNLVDVWPDPQLAKAVVKTLASQFRHVHLWLEEGAPATGRVTYVVSATDDAEPPPVLHAQRGFERRWWRATQAILADGTPLDALPLLRDDHVPVERLVARLLVSELGR